MWKQLCYFTVFWLTCKTNKNIVAKRRSTDAHDDQSNSSDFHLCFQDTAKSLGQSQLGNSPGKKDQIICKYELLYWNGAQTDKEGRNNTQIVWKQKLHLLFLHGLIYGTLGFLSEGMAKS